MFVDQFISLFGVPHLPALIGAGCIPPT